MLLSGLSTKKLFWHLMPRSNMQWMIHQPYNHGFPLLCIKILTQFLNTIHILWYERKVFIEWETSQVFVVSPYLNFGKKKLLLLLYAVQVFFFSNEAPAFKTSQIQLTETGSHNPAQTSLNSVPPPYTEDLSSHELCLHSGVDRAS